MSLGKLDIEGNWFVDQTGRRIILRGVNLGGDCKVPYPDGHTNRPTDFSDHETVSFIGRPFPLSEAEEHLTRLQAWGFNCLRLLTTWEAIEHAGPRRYDEAYLDYYAELCRLAGEHGLYVFVDFHQDVWSRMTGGDGAPAWLFEKVGLDFTKFHEAGAAHVMQYKYDFARGGRQEDNYPTMTWAQNYAYPANAIMWTLFFAGKTFTPDFEIDGQNVQDYLQQHYMGCLIEVAKRIEHMPHVIGFDTLNEPGSGYVGKPLSYQHVARTDINPRPPRPGLAWSPLDGFAVAHGLPRAVPRMGVDREQMKIVQQETETINPTGVSIWRDGAKDPFEAAGAYRFDGNAIHVEREDFFIKSGNRTLDMEEDFMGPFFQAVADAVRGVRPDWLIFSEMDPPSIMSGHNFPETTPERSVNASHWYDIVTLATKIFTYPDKLNPFNGKVLHGKQEIEGQYVKELEQIKAAAGPLNGGDGAPTLIGEFGIPFDLNGAEAYEKFAGGDRSSSPWQMHIVALDLMYNALDRLFLHATHWNYTASNQNDLAVGDGWNQEDLSIFSRDQQTDPDDINSGGRALEGFVRPFARATAGKPLNMVFDLNEGTFTYAYEARAGGVTEVFVPYFQFPHGYALQVDGGTAKLAGNQCLEITAEGAGEITVMVTRQSAEQAAT